MKSVHKTSLLFYCIEIAETKPIKTTGVFLKGAFLNLTMNRFFKPMRLGEQSTEILAFLSHAAPGNRS